MATTDTSAPYRIYCICGQKMRVSEAMFGRPGKCVACRQKIRIPRRDDFPGETHEVYLRERPEFLRKPPKPAASLDPTATELEDIALGAGEPTLEVVPMEVLPALRRLCSYEHAVNAQLKPLGESGLNEPAPDGKAALLGYRALARQARAHLEERLRARLMEVAVTLADVKEKIARTVLGLRAGELSYEQFVRSIDELRQQRLALSAERLNLRGWLATTDMALAGGELEVDLESAPIDLEKLSLPDTPVPPGNTTLDRACAGLRQALEARRQAERRRDEWRAMAERGALAQYQLQAYEVDLAATIERAQSARRFYQKRLKSLGIDYEGDVDAARAALKVARAALEAGDLDKERYHKREMALLRGQADLGIARDVAQRAAAANSPEDLPRTQGLLGSRPSRTIATGTLGVDSWLYWGAAIALMLVTFAPLADNPGGNAVAARALVLACVAVAVVLGVASSLPRPTWRGILGCVVWLGGTLGAAAYLNTAYYSLGLLGEHLRATPFWWLGGGYLLLAGACLLTGAAWAWTLLPRPGYRAFGISAGAVGALAVLLIGTNLFGFWAPAPTLEVEVGQPIENADTRTVRVQVANGGLRPLYIHRPGSRVPQPRTFIVERATDADTWQDVTFTARALEQPTTMGGVADLGQVPIAIAPQGDRMVVRYALKPGDYRVMLREEQPERTPLVATFSVEPVPAPAAAPAAPSAPAPTPQSAAPTPPRTAQVEVQLLGVLASDGDGPRIRMVVTTLAGESTRLSLQLNDAVLGPWSVREYNPQNQTVTLADRTSLRVVGVGERITLDVPRTALSELPSGSN